MRYKKHMIILLAAIFLFAMATASAADSNDTAVAVDDGQLTDEIIQASENQENMIQASNNDEVNLSEDDSGKLAIANDKKLGKTVTEHTFEAIQDAIGEGESTIYLEPGTYTGNNYISIIGKSNVKIIGDSTILDAQGQTRIFYIRESSNITIQNIIFKNGYFGGDGGAIEVYYSCRDCSISNCTFINNHARSGGAIDWDGQCVNGRVSNCTFINNHAEMGGGAIRWSRSNDGRVNNCTFINNTAEDDGDAISASACDLNADYNWFGNTATNYNDQLPITDEVKCDYRLFLKATANPDTITGKDTSNVTFKLYQYGSGVISDYDNAPFKNLDLTITATKGNVGGTAKLGEPIQFTPTRGGTACVTATVEDVRQTVEINVKGDFDLLQDLVNNESLSVINLERNYTYNELDTITGGVRINRPITINGNGFTIDAKGKSRIFYVTAGSINITDVTLKNGKANYGGAIYVHNAIDNVNIDATFINNTATYEGGANYFVDTVSDSDISGTYINNTAGDGGANYFVDTVSDSDISGTYINNTASGYGGANYFVDTVSDSDISGTYINNTAKIYGGANYFNNAVSNVNIFGTYINNTAGDGGANRFEGVVSDSYISGTYINNTAKLEGGANCFIFTVSNVNISGIYINNTADGNALIYFADSYNEGLNVTIGDAIFINNKCPDVIYAETNGVVAYNNWFGNNATNYNEKPETYNVNMISWLFLNATADSSRIGVGNSSKIAFVLQSCNETSDVGFYDASKMNVNLTLSQTLGELNKTSALIGEKITYTAKNVGNSTVTGKFETVSYTLSLTNTKNPTNITVANSTVDLKVDDVVDSGATLTPADAGNLTYTSSNTSVAIVENGKIKALANGTAVITVSFLGNENYFAAENKTINVTVNLKDAIISVNNSTLDLFVGDNFTVVATTTPAGLKVTFVQDDSGVYIVDENGNVTALKEGTGHILVKVGGDGVYAENTTEITVSVSKIPTEITLTNATLDLKVNEIVDGLANLTPADAGNVTYTISNSSVVKVKDGKVIALAEGETTITVSFAGDKKYAAAESKNITVTVSLKEASVSVNNSTLDLFVDDNFTIVATTVPDGLNVTYVPDNSGVISVDESGEVTALKEGTATITVKVGGDGIYAENSTAISVTVNKQDANVNVSMPANVTVGDNSTVSVKLPSDATGNVTVKVDDTVVSTVPVTDGTASVKLPKLGAGNHTVEIAYSGDDKYKPASKTATITINKDSTNITAADVTATYKVDKYLVITLKDSDGNPLANATVTVDLNTIKNCTTDKNGQIKIKVSNLLPKTYNAKITFAGNNNYLGSDATAKVVVKKATPKITASAKTFKTTTKTKKYAIILKDNTGKAIKNAKVTLKVNGKTYTAKTNSKGKATFKITKLAKKGTFKATITYKGSKYYNKVTKKANIKVISTWKTISKGSKLKSTVKEIQRALKNNGYYLTAYGHYLKVDGIYWDYTVKAVKQFQKAKGLKVTGKVDEKTAKKLGLI